MLRPLIAAAGALALTVTLLGGAQLATAPAVAAEAAPATLSDLWDGTAHLELQTDRLMNGQDASGSNVVVVGDTWYWFHRNVVDVATWKLGTVVEESVDGGQTWSAATPVVQPEAGTPWAQMVTDGTFWYDADADRWRALLQTNDGTNPWTISYFERAGSDPMGAFTTPEGFSNPGVDAKELWNQITTQAGKDSVDIPGGTGLVFDEGTPQIVEKVGDEYYVTFHGASATDGTTHGYRGLAKTTDFQNWEPAADDAIVDQYDATSWNESWTPSDPVGAGAASILKQDGYYYQIVEATDVNLNGMAGQHWAMGLMRSTDLTSTSWESWSGNALFATTGQVVEWQYPTIFTDAGGATYVAMTKYAPDTESGFRVYKIVDGAPSAEAGVPNVVENPSFESTASWSLDDGFTMSDDRARSGSRSLASDENGRSARTRTAIGVQPDTDYVLSGWVYKSSSDGAAYLDMADIPGEATAGVADGAGAGVWTHVSAEWNSGSNTSVVLRAVTDSGIDATVYFDDLSLVQAEDGNILLNPSFENSTTSSSAWSTGSFTVSADRARTGSQSYTTSTAAVSTVSTAPVYLLPYTDYELSVWVSKDAGAGAVYCDLNGVTDQPSVSTSGATGGSWVQLSQTWNSGTQWSVIVRCGTTDGLDGAVYLDDVSLARVDGGTGEVLFGADFDSTSSQPTWSDTPNDILGVSGSTSSIRTDNVSRSGDGSLLVAGTDDSPDLSYSISKVYDVDIPVTADTTLSYWFLPSSEAGRHVTVDLLFTDGTTLRDSGALDFEAIRMHPVDARGIVGVWRHVGSRIGLWTAGKTIDRILVDYDDGPDTGAYETRIDDLYIRD
ncbi:MAG: hypothetical protein QM626_04160 [Microbacterium sp.]|uniref:hypothetical protein n=1 Tax=Microbacterium sp. TaxID=51671 RepID=UPI0039E384B4